MKMKQTITIVPLIFLAALFALSNPTALAQTPSTDATVTIPQCLISLIDEVDVPAEESGVLVALPPGEDGKPIIVKEGTLVKAKAPIAKVDDTMTILQRKIAVYKLNVAHEEMTNDISVRYATSTMEVAKAEVDQANTANNEVPGTVPAAEVRRLMLKQREAELSIDNAKMKLEVAKHEYGVAYAELEAAMESVRRLTILSPFEGMVVERYRDEGEWVKPGDPVMRIVRLDTLRVEGFINASDYSPAEIFGKKVTVTVQLERGHAETFPGDIVFVDPRIQANNEFRVWAEVNNRKEHTHWILGPGRQCAMTIHLDSVPSN